MLCVHGRTCVVISNKYIDEEQQQDIPVEPDSCHDIEPDVDPHESEVHPSVGPPDIHACQELIGDPKSTVRTVGGSLWVL